MANETKTTETTRTPSIIESLVRAIAPESQTAQNIARGVSDVIGTSVIANAVVTAAQAAVASFGGADGLGIGNMAKADNAQLGVMSPPSGIPGPTPEILAARAQQNRNSIS